MARGYDKHRARLDEIALLGKDLARRAKRKCELCEAGDDLRPHDTAPDSEPGLDALVLLCERCRAVADGRRDDPRTLRFLEGAVWSEVPVVAQLARALLAEVDAGWARDTLDMLG
jgi:protein PhnA